MGVEKHNESLQSDTLTELPLGLNPSKLSTAQRQRGWEGGRGLGGFTKKSEKSQSDLEKKRITFPGCICFSQFKNIRAELVDPGK